jgi:hypothetical protein
MVRTCWSARRRLGAAAALIAGLGLISGCQYGVTSSTPTTPSQSPGTSGSGNASGPTTLTFVKDVQPILNSDCVRCHGGSRRDAGVDLSTYANVMRYVTAGNANSLLIQVTRSGGLMYGQFSGNRTQKSTTIHDWIVSSNAAQQ